MKPDTHTCTSIAPGCSHATMTTWKRKKKGNKTTCLACSTNVREDRPQHS